MADAFPVIGMNERPVYFWIEGRLEEAIEICPGAFRVTWDDVVVSIYLPE